MKYLLMLIAAIAIGSCTKDTKLVKPINWSATEYRYVYDSPDQPFINHIRTYISIHFHNLSDSDLPQFRAAEAYGPYQICPGDSTLSHWKVTIDTCKL